MTLRHPKTIEALSMGRALTHASEDMFERIDKIRVRRPSPSGRVIPEVDGAFRLTALYIAPGTIASSTDNRELVADIMAAIHESTVDAALKHKQAIQETVWPDIPKVPWVQRRR